jgi:hypothetical protein
MTVSGLSEAALVEFDEFFHAAVELLRIRGSFGDAMADVVLKEFCLESPQRGVDGGNGIEDFGAIPVLLDHPADSLNLPDNPVYPAKKGLRFVTSALHGNTYRGYKYICKGEF